MLDKFGEKLAQEADQAIGRRSMIAKMGKGILLLVGCNLIPQVPTFAQDARQGHRPGNVGQGHRPGDVEVMGCTLCAYCNLLGYPCSHCGGSDSSCPRSDQYSGGSWYGCCCGTLWKYQDCCGGSAVSCSGWCDRNEGGSRDHSMCGASPYRCTKVLRVGSC